MFALSLLFAFLALMLLPAAYAIGARNLLMRFGRSALPALLVVVSFGLSALGSWRISTVTPATAAYRPFDTNPFWMISLYAGVLMIGLLPTTIRVAKTRPGAAQPSRTRQVFGEIPWFLLGLLIAFSILMALDVAGLAFLPPSSQAPPSGAV
jgi:hypothetical protein